MTFSYNHNAENWVTSLGQQLFDNSMKDVLLSVHNWRCLRDTCLSEIELLITSTSILKCSQVTGQNLSLPALNKALQLHKIISSNFFKRKPNHGAENIIWFTRHLIRALHKLNKIQSTYLSSNLKMLQPKTYYNRIPDMWWLMRFLFNDGKWWPHLDKIARFLFTKSTSISL